jgi:hypothetical protein
MGQKFTNRSRALLLAPIAATDTGFTIEAGKADRFPVANTDAASVNTGLLDWFKIVLTDASGNQEIAYVRTRTIGSGALTNVLRGQEGTTALAFALPTTVRLMITAQDIQDAKSGVFAKIATDSLTATDALFTGKIKTGAAPGVEGRFVPIGGIIAYDGPVTAIPAGWLLCDGTRGTPNLSNSFIMGAAPANAQGISTTPVGKTGGSKDSTLPLHSHGVTAGGNTGGMSNSHSHAVYDPAHEHAWGVNDQNGTQPGGGNLGGGGGARGNAAPTTRVPTGISLYPADSDHYHYVSVTGGTDTRGASPTDTNLPPYYVLAWIKCMASP